MEQPTPENTVAGVKFATLVFAFMGSAVALSYTKEMTRVQAITAAMAGTAVSVSATPLVLHYLSLDGTLERAIAFFAGLVGMRAVPVLFALVDRFRDFKLPQLPDNKE